MKEWHHFIMSNGILRSQDHFKAPTLLCCEAIVLFLQSADRAWNTEYAAQVYPGSRATHSAVV